MARDINESLGKLPPQAPDLEEAILGSLMLERHALESVRSFLKPDHFYVEAHKIIYIAIMDLANESQPIDMRTVVARLRKNGSLDLVEGAFKIAHLTSQVSSAANIEYHARIVIEMAYKRNLIELASQIHSEAYEDTTDVFEMLDRTEKIFDQLRVDIASGAITASSMKEEIHQLAVTIQDRANAPEGESAFTGVRSGYLTVDRITQGWQDSDLIIIAGRPGMAKTTLALNFGINAATMFNVPVAFFSLEMSTKQLVMKAVSSETSISFRDIRGKKFDNLMWNVFTHKTAKLASSPIFIDDTAGLSIIEFRARCRRLKQQHNIKLIIVDYLQLMRGEQTYRGNRETEISSISRGLKLVAKELNVPVIALSQLSRSVETRGGMKRPILADLRESGAIEQDADAVIFIWRPEYYGIKENEDGDLYAPGYTLLDWGKHRNGATAEVALRFVGQSSQFTELDEKFVPRAPVGANIPFEVVRNVEKMVDTKPAAEEDMPF